MADDLSESDDTAFYRKKLLLSTIIPGIFLFFMWMTLITETLFGFDLKELGIYPMQARGLAGLIFSPFIHGDFGHLVNNSLPFFFLSTALFYFYSEVAIKIFFVNFFITGLLVWLWGNSGWHIGASGVVYGLASFLFFSGIIRRYYRLVALSLLIVFLYGGMVWGIFPGIYQNISWESHMLGFLSGIVLAIWFRNEGPQATVPEWMNDETDEPGETDSSEARGA